MTARLQGMWEDLNTAAALARHELTPRQRTTLEIGSSAVFAMLAFGIQLGRWSLWSVPAALAGYYVWVMAYSEATVRVTRRDRRASG